MEVEILYFAALKDYFPSREIKQIDSNTTVAALKEILAKEIPNAEKIIKVSRVSINQRIAKESEIIPKNSSLAILPPSSGG
ncbi:MoaD/ThiS family protein [Leptospira jelokensis]|uniref:MoaD/ThiS family protein n=1 Tax=Leptospira jelokensis TaxID=2484931 RepID=A0A4Z0ZXF5_9LEPT|nr:MoaD/ThiS family protein [Leptospira jelokensis]TGL75969.1 MoaD/ThiS family protein [Leptospira jelokensis]TGM05337.1 MoaD/ThiS family protein [Leptospira jelokensis]